MNEQGSPVTKALAIARVNLVRSERDRQGLFFVLVLPMILIIVLGTTYGGQGTARIGVADADGGPFATALTTAIAANDDLRIDIRRYGTADDLRDAVSRGFVEFGLVIPAGYDSALRDGGTAALEYLAPPTTMSSAVRPTVERAVAAQSAIVRAARFAMAANGVSVDEALAAARAAQAGTPGVAVTVESVASSATAGVSGFSIGAQSQVILFMFLTALTGSVELITTRQLGISRRMLSTTTSAGTIILGEGMARVVLALFQGAFIVIASALLFNVDWANPLATTAIIVVFSFVSGGAAMLIGVTAANASQAGSMGPALGMLLGLLGGTMVPPEVFPDSMRTLSHVTPHAWALDAFRKLLLDNASFVDVLPQLAVLVGFAVLLLGLATWRFRRVLGSGG
jgi:linearmycin/streptolysin S transport system permease protein